MKKIVVSIAVVVAVALIVGFVPLIEVPYPVTVQYQDTETYYVDEPYEETVETRVPLEYQVVSHGSSVYVQFVTIMNRDEVGGHFTLRQTIYVIDRDDWADVEWEGQQGSYVDYDSDSRFTRYDIAETIYLEPGEAGEVRYDAKEISGRTSEEIWVERKTGYEIVPDEKIVEETVVKYRQVERERTVTRERVETRYKKGSIFEYLRARYQG